MKGNKNDGYSGKNMKARWDLLPMGSISEVVDILTKGSIEYGENNWKKVEPFNKRYYAAMMRHISAYSQGEIKDKKSGKNHLAHVICNAIFLIEGGDIISK